MPQGYICFDRDITQWEWYNDTNTFRVFFHLLMKANWEENNYMGNKIARGSLVFSRSTLASELGLSEQNIRTALSHLSQSGEIKIEANHKFSILSVCDYEKWTVSKKKEKSRGNQETNQASNQETNQESNQVEDVVTTNDKESYEGLGEQGNQEDNQASNQVGNQESNANLRKQERKKEDKKEIKKEEQTKEENEIDESISQKRDLAEMAIVKHDTESLEPISEQKKKKFVKPTIQDIQTHILEKGYTFDAEAFYAFYESNGWKVGKNPMKNWKAACTTWQKKRETEKNNYNGRTRTHAEKLRDTYIHANEFSRQLHEQVGKKPYMGGGDKESLW